MAVTQATNSSKWDQIVKPSAEEVYEGFRNVLDWTEGFGLVFAKCSPVQGNELIEQIKKDLPNKRVEVLRFQEGEEIRNLYNLVEALPNREQIDILFIRGLEYSFVPYIKPGYGGQGDYYKLDNLPPILGHLNLQRERFRRDFEICFVFLLPFFGIKYFIQRAPDFFDWRLGLFSVPTNKDLINLEVSNLMRDLNYDQCLQWSFSQRMSRILEIENLIQEDLSSLDKADLLINQGNLWAASLTYEEAIISYDKAIQFDPNYYPAWYNRGLALAILERYEEAIASFDNVLKIKPDDYHAWNNRGIELGNLGRMEEAIASFDNALKFKPDLYRAWNNRGIALGNLGRLEEAIDSFDNALKFKPDDYFAWQNRGNELFHLGRMEEAITSFDNALKFKPDLQEAWNNRGYALLKTGNYQEAIDSIDKALKINVNPQIYESKAYVYILLDRIDLAIKNLRYSIELNANRKQAILNNPDFDKIRNDSRFIDLINQSD